jgi:MurE/MurF fusion protein
MLLKNLIKTNLKSHKNIKINGLELDSRKVKKGCIFFALKGNKLNGAKYINEAIKKGASAIVCHKNIKFKSKVIPIIKTENVRKILGESCQIYFKNKPKNIIAVTGTNGKSSVANFFHQILLLNKIKVASIGTLGIKKNNINKNNNLTSPDIITLHKELNKIKKSKIDNVIIEASSHGLHQARLDGINFLSGIFTNLSQDHLDYHKSMKNYFNAKMILFSKLLKKNKSIITDNEIKEFNSIKKIAKKRSLKIKTINKKLVFKLKKLSNLLGIFQIKNLSMSVLAARNCGLSYKKIFKVIEKLQSVNGRLQLIRILKNKTKIFIDYAHTPAALEATLKSLSSQYKNIILVFGCGGERDKKKRGVMANVAKSYCEKIYITDDNPRRENPKKIRSEIIKNLKNSNYKEVSNRQKAIETSIKESKPFDVILVAGKGHETTQDYGHRIINISDKKIIKSVKDKNKKINDTFNNNCLNSKILKKILKTKKNYNFKGVVIDSKNVKKGNLFISIKGKKNDGHDYVKEAIKNGAKYFLASRKNFQNLNKKKIYFYNSEKFLNIFAHEKRKYTNAKIIAVTGSSGKTSVKNLLGNLLNTYSKTYFSPKSFNNHYGVPLSLSNLEEDNKYGVFEVGMSKPGEINALSKLVRPDFAIITNVAPAHIENFRNLAEIAKAKGEIINNLNKKGTLIINRDDKFYYYLKKLADRKKINTVSFGYSKKSDVYPIYIRKKKNYIDLKIKIFDEIVSLKIRDINILNVLVVFAILKLLRLDLSKSLNSFKNIEPMNGRGKISLIKRYGKKINLIDESYNANPLSVQNALIKISSLKKKNLKKYILLGDMLELGKKSNYFHKNISNIINKTDIDKVFVYGNKIFETYKNIKKNKRGNILQYTSDFDEIFSKILQKNDYLMIKGSNATGLNNLCSNLIKEKKHVI